jgi:8-oxo-dGTP pyrophosphatase MutT (NUDIX family)
MKEFAHAVILVRSAYGLQLRDNIPGIAYPGMWSLFGGALEPDEDPERGLRREIMEELGIALGGCRFLWQIDRFSEFWRQPSRHWFFVVDATHAWPSHVLREGKAAGLFRFEELPREIVPLAREAIQRHSERSSI